MKSRHVDIHLNVHDIAVDARLAEDVIWSVRLDASTVASKSLTASLSKLAFFLNNQGRPAASDAQM